MTNKWKEIVDKLISKNITIATMESCTGGGIANEITNISGASSILHESYVTYCNEAKIKQGVPAEIIEKYTVYSPETAEAMAKAVRENAKKDIGIGVTGQLGRIDPKNPVDKLNHVWFAIVKSNGKIIVKELTVPEDNRAIQKEFIILEIGNVLVENI